jgi:C2H2-type zinc finger
VRYGIRAEHEPQGEVCAMSTSKVHQCPECPLRFSTGTELDWHLRNEHPKFRHDYPGRRPPPK